MKLLKTFELPEDVKGGESAIRETCRVVLFDEQNLIGLLWAANENYHKLPGGGIEGIEDKLIALQREILEETGCKAEITQEIGMIIEQNSNHKQISYCYIGKVLDKGIPTFTKEETERGFELQRVSLQDAIELLKNDKPINMFGERIQKRDLCILETVKEISLT